MLFGKVASVPTKMEPPFFLISHKKPSARIAFGGLEVYRASMMIFPIHA